MAENVLDRQFEPEAPNRAWTADITYIATGEGWLYLAAVEDLYSRRIVGWSMGARIDSRLVVDALEMALARRLPGEGLVAHSDRGSQYASEHYQGLLAGHGITCSMSRRANCWDNAPMESFFASLKKELTRGEIFATREEARASIFEYIEVFLQPGPAAFVAGIHVTRRVALLHERVRVIERAALSSPAKGSRRNPLAPGHPRWVMMFNARHRMPASVAC